MHHQHPMDDDDDAPWDEALSYSPTSSHPALAFNSPSSSTEGALESQNNKSQDDKDSSLLHSPEATSMTLKAKSKPKKRSKKQENGNDPLQCHQTLIAEVNNQDSASIATESMDSKDLSSEALNTSNNKSKNNLHNSSSHGKPSSTNSKKSTRENLKDDSKPLSFKDSKPREYILSGEVPPGSSSNKATRKSRIDTKLERHANGQNEEQPLVNKPKTKGNASRSTGTTKGVLKETRSTLSSHFSMQIDPTPDLASSDTSESKDVLVDDRSLGSLSLNSALMDSVMSFESQSSDLRTKVDLAHARKSRQSKKQRSEGSLVVPKALQALSTVNSSEDGRNGDLGKHDDSPKNKLISPSSKDLDSLLSDSDPEPMEHSTTDLQDLMPPLKRKPSKGSQHESKVNTINAAEILKKKIMQMNEALRLKAFNGNSCSHLQTGELSLDQSPLSSKSDHAISTRRPSRTLSGNAEKFRQSCRSLNPLDNLGDTPPTPRRRTSVDGSTPRRRKSVDGSSTRRRERLDASTVKEVRRRLKLRGTDEESSIQPSKVKSKSPRRNSRERSTSVSRRSLSKSESNIMSNLSQESTTVTTDLDTPTMTTPETPLKQVKSKPSSSKKSSAKDGNKVTNTLPSDTNDSVSSGQQPENVTDDVKDVTTTSGKTIKSPKSHRKNKEAKPSSQGRLLQKTERSYSFTSARKNESIQKKEHIIRSRSQSPSRKGKRQPKSLLNPETLDAWQISQQQKHRVTPFPSVYCRRLDDDDDDDDDLNPAMLLPPAFRQLQVGQKPKSSRF